MEKDELELFLTKSTVLSLASSLATALRALDRAQTALAEFGYFNEAREARYSLAWAYRAVGLTVEGKPE